MVSLVGRPAGRCSPRTCTPGRRLLVLGSDGRTPAEVAALLAERGYGASRLTVLEQLGGAGGAVVHRHADDLAARRRRSARRDRRRGGRRPGHRAAADRPGLPDDAYEHDGQLTKREVRAVTWPGWPRCPGELLWDVGAGAGLHRHRVDARAPVLPRGGGGGATRPRRADQRGTRRARRAGPARWSTGRAPDALAGLPHARRGLRRRRGSPRPGCSRRCWEALRPGGRLVVNAVTWRPRRCWPAGTRGLGGDLVRIGGAARGAASAAFTGWSRRCR